MTTCTKAPSANLSLRTISTEAATVERSIFVLSFQCVNRPGIVASAATALFETGGDILDAQQFDDPETGMFFGRIEFAAGSLSAHKDRIAERVDRAFRGFEMKWSLRRRDARYRVLLLVSAFDHCLADLLYRWRTGELEMEIAGVASNHPRDTFKHLHFASMPFHYLPVTMETRAAQESRIWDLVCESRADLVVLARYMQVLSDDLARKLTGRCINIHHSFLPGFKGAKPYAQAHARGVKLIGATAHYVTSDLDEGPIIEQDVERVSQRDTPDILIRKGRDIERRVLSRAVRWHIDDRVFLNGAKTVVFPD